MGKKTPVLRLCLAFLQASDRFPRFKGVLRKGGQDKGGPQKALPVTEATRKTAHGRTAHARGKATHFSPHPLPVPQRNARLPERACATRGGKRWRGSKPVHCERGPPPRARARPRHSHSLTGARHGPCLTPGACAGCGMGEEGGVEGRAPSGSWLSYAEKFLEKTDTKGTWGMGSEPCLREDSLKSKVHGLSRAHGRRHTAKEEAWGQGAGLGDGEWRRRLKDGEGAAGARGSEG